MLVHNGIEFDPESSQFSTPSRMGNALSWVYCIAT